jgi:hypothetical protein
VLKSRQKFIDQALQPDRAMVSPHTGACGGAARRRRELAQRLEDHEVHPLVRLLPDPRICPQSEDLDVAPVGVADLPSGTVVDLRAVADGDNGFGIS